MADKGSVVVTGASSGIGEACAKALAAAGYRVYAGVRKPEDGERLRGEAGERLVPLSLDVTSAEAIAEAARRIDEELGIAPLAGLVNNAGITVNSPLEFVPIDDLRRQLDVNVVGQVAVTQAFLPRLRAARGRIVIIGSSSGYFSSPMMGPYTMSKFAVESMADTLRRELNTWGIRVALIQPGAIESRIWEKGLSDADAFLASAPEALHTLYGPLVARIRTLAEQTARQAIPAEAVARRVMHAMESRRPKTRYRVGTDAVVQRWIARLPDRVQDLIVGRFFGI
jgi:NAD(P)-dependent dehydrogenase (short-subunit alcohol dehydrogenase family)